MKICIFGGREFTDYEWLKDEVKAHIHNKAPVEEYGNIEIITGGARGADALGKRFAEEYNLKHAEFKADWQQHGKAAGPIRNREMANYTDIGIGFHDDKSRGTANMINTLRKTDKPVHIIHY